MLHCSSHPPDSPSTPSRCGLAKTDLVGIIPKYPLSTEQRAAAPPSYSSAHQPAPRGYTFIPVVNGLNGAPTLRVPPLSISSFPILSIWTVHCPTDLLKAYLRHWSLFYPSRSGYYFGEFGPTIRPALAAGSTGQ